MSIGVIGVNVLFLSPVTSCLNVFCNLCVNVNVNVKYLDIVYL